MAEFDLRLLNDDSFVVHIGGLHGEANAITFGTTVATIARVLQAINDQINPGHELDVLIEDTRAGSYRARIKTKKRIVRRILSATVSNIVMGLFVNYIYDVLHPSQPPVIIVSEDTVVVEYGDDRVVISRDMLTMRERIVKSEVVNREMRKAIQALEEDEDVSSIGVSPSFAEKVLLVDLPRSSFPIFLENLQLKPFHTTRYRDHETTLTVVKAVFERSTRKWEFVWQGFDISAPIRDQSFFDRLEARKISIRHGDSFRATLRVHQTFVEEAGVWMNDAYEVLAVGDQIGSLGEQLSVEL